MNKKVKYSIVYVLVMALLFSQSTVFAAEVLDGNSTKTIEYLEDGSCFETEIVVNNNARSTVTGASKTITYKNAAGEKMWYVKVVANFYFNGSTSECTSASAYAGSYVSTWKIEDVYSSRSGNWGAATAVAGDYYLFTRVGTVTKTAKLSCDKNGNVS